MFRDDLHSVLKLGWEASRRAWRLLAPGQETTFVPESIGSSGRDLDQLAYDLRRLGYEKPARMAFSIAFILNGLSAQSIQFDRDLADKSSLIVGILAEMLLELESTSQVTAEEPKEIVEHLEQRCGLVMYTDHPADSQPPRPHFRRNEIPEPTDDGDRSAMLAVSEQLFTASTSLLNRAMCDSEFPYFSTVSRIQHLGKTLRDQLTPRTQQVADVVRPAADSDAKELPLSGDSVSCFFPQQPAVTIGSVESTRGTETRVPYDEAVEPEHGQTQPDSDPDSPVSHVVGAPLPLVFIIDDSPFFRMLLTSAIEADGYAAAVAANLAEAETFSNQTPWSILICGTTMAGPSGEWLQDRIRHDGCRVITLVHGVPEVSADERLYQVRRTDLASLRGLVQQILGPSIPRIRMIA